MTRQINLNSGHVLAGFGSIQLPVFLTSFAIATVIGLAWMGLSWVERQSLLAEASHWQAQVDQKLVELQDFHQQYPEISNETQLKALNARYSDQLKTARQTYVGLSNHIETSIEGFVGPLTQLSNFDLDGLWLHSILLQNGTDSFTLTGYARDPALIPQYFEQLGQSTFGNVSISHLMLAKEKNNDLLWNFTLSNKSQLEGEY